MADYDGIEIGGVDSHLDKTTVAYQSNAPNSVATVDRIPFADLFSGPYESTLESLDPPISTDYAAATAEDPGQFFFARVWSKPGRIELGNIISTVRREIELYNSYRDAARSLTAATPNAGPGVVFDNLPGLPFALGAQEGLLFDVVVSTSGPPDIDGTLDFTLDSGSLSIPITGSRVLLFPYEPETPIAETLQFATDILRAADGSEQRVSVRKHPRQIFDMTFLLEEGEDRRRFHTQVAGGQAAIFGLPVWFEGRPLGADAVATDTSITVDTTYGDFRAGALVILWTSPSYFESLEIASLTATSITFSSALTQDFDVVDTIVMPLRLSRARGAASGAKFIKNLDQYKMQFTVLDNEADLADTSAYATLDSKVVLDDPNWVGSSPTIADNIVTRVEAIDNETSSLVQFTDWNIAQYHSTKGFIANSPAALWQIRQLVHALRGSQLSFYIPTFYADVVADSTLGSGSDQITIEHIGYTDNINTLDPMGALWVLKTDGTVVTRTVTASEEIDAATERLTVDSIWGTEILVSEIDRISFLRLARITNDEVRIEHVRPGTARAVMSIVGVQQ